MARSDEAPGRSVLAAADIAVWYGKFQAVESASFEIGPGEFVSLIGPNGHGKSSLAGALAGVVARTGEVRINGSRVPSGNPIAAIRAGLVLVPERRHLYPSMTVRDNILLGRYSKTTKWLAHKAWAEVVGVLDLFPELADRLAQRTGTLSGGQQQMVALARGLAAQPDVLVLDEPCLGLSESVAARVYAALAQLSATDVSVLLVEENPSRALQVSTRVLHVHQGRIAAAS
ncbi:MAG TPA: ATP-binding cassette domain-containing protein [Pseudonocardiaceae bacterium]|nr:ATP-binding cassette domain-containing protein [Pseudonocardiaceae bacterium]